MAYRLRRDESVPAGLRRLARKSLKTASEELQRRTPPGDAAIHEARKGLKKARVMLRLLEDDHGAGLGKAPKQLRAVNRTLSSFRDADAMLEILDKLRKRDRRLFNDWAHARVRRRLSGFRTLGDGIRRSLKRGRKAMARARKTETAQDYHEWRKEMKALWYELRLLEECDSRIKHDVAVLHRAQRWLGDEHNLVVLCARLSREPSIDNGMIDPGRFKLAVDRYQRELRKKAVARAAAIYRRQPGAYVRAIKRAWKTWRQHARRARAAAA